MLYTGFSSPGSRLPPCKSPRDPHGRQTFLKDEGHANCAETGVLQEHTEYVLFLQRHSLLPQGSFLRRGAAFLIGATFQDTKSK